MSRTAGAAKIAPLMVPYLLWVTYATALSYSFHVKNPQVGQEAGWVRRGRDQGLVGAQRQGPWSSRIVVALG